MITERETPLLGGGATREFKQLDSETLVATELNASSSRKFCFYLVKENLVPRFFFSIDEVPHFWTVACGYLFVIGSAGLQVKSIVSEEEQKTI